ncbi:MAG: PCC domain-containing protein [Candidatus Rokuibacteriota bacterium]
MRGRAGPIVVVRLAYGDLLLESLEEICRRLKIRNGVILTGFGSLTDFSVTGVRGPEFPPRRFYNRRTPRGIEIIAMSGVIANYHVHSHVVLCDNYGGLIVPLAVDAFGIFLMRQYIKDLPDSLIEAARLDGCSERGIFWRIILPNCKPALGALALLTFRDNWDQFLWPLIVASRDTLKTFPLGLAQMEGIDSAAYHEIMAIAVLGMFPTAIIFLLFQRAFVRGIALSGLKE